MTTSCSFRAELPVAVRRRDFPGDLMHRSHARNAPADPMVPTPRWPPVGSESAVLPLPAHVKLRLGSALDLLLYFAFY